MCRKFMGSLNVEMMDLSETGLPSLCSPAVYLYLLAVTKVQDNLSVLEKVRSDDGKDFPARGSQKRSLEDENSDNGGSMKKIAVGV